MANITVAKLSMNLLFLSFVSASLLENLSADSNVDELWPLYKKQHNKNYGPDEDTERFEIFKSNVKRMIEHNEKFAKGEVSYSMGINQFADKKPEEFRSNLGRLPKKPDQ